MLCSLSDPSGSLSDPSGSDCRSSGGFSSNFDFADILFLLHLMFLVVVIFQVLLFVLTTLTLTGIFLDCCFSCALGKICGFFLLFSLRLTLF